MESIRYLLLPLLLCTASAAPAGEHPTRPAAAGGGHADRADRGDRTDKTERGDASRKHPATERGTVNLNQADSATLELLPGVGEKKAERIIAYRHAHPFKKVEELTKVRGFGRKTFARLRPYLTIAGPSTLGADKSASN